MNALSNNLFLFIIGLMDLDLAKIKQFKDVVFSHFWIFNLVYIDNIAIRAIEESR